MSDFQLDSSGSEMDESDIELQEAFAAGLLKPGINTIHKARKQAVNNVRAINEKYNEIKLKLPWIERLDCVNALAPLAPELAATLLSEEQKRENKLKNNKKLPQIAPSDDPVLNDFKREMLFHRQAQAAVLYSMPLLKGLGKPTIRPDDYLAEMAKTDVHMQKIRENLMNKQQQQQRSERVKQLRHQRKEGKALQIQTKIQRQADKRQMLDQVKKVRKGMSKDMSFLDNKKTTGGNKKVLAKRQMKDKKFGFGGKKRGTKGNTRESAADVSEYRNSPKAGGKFGGNRGKGTNTNGKKRPGKQRRTQAKNKK